MKGNSDTYPERFKKRAGKTHFRYGIEAVEKQDMNGSVRQSYDYDYVVITGEVTKAKILRAMIADKFSIEDEIALINNEMASAGTAEYAAYKAYRNAVKLIAKEVVK